MPRDTLLLGVSSPVWMPTGPAARALNCSIDTLKRYAKRDEFLIEGKHWRRGAYPNSPWVWNIPACWEAIRWQGRLEQGMPRHSSSTAKSGAEI